jgi:DNA-binding beta-propeller fold protein YncE
MAPEQTPDPVSSQEPQAAEPDFRAQLPTDPRHLTARERRRRIILLTLLLLLLALLGYTAYYFAMNRTLPGLRIAPAGSDYIQPPRFLYAIAGKDATSLVRPVGLGVAPDGRVYVVDFGHRRISVFTNAGRYLFSFDTTADGKLMNAVHLAIKGNEVWVTDRYRHALYVFDLSGKYLRKFEPKNETLSWTPLAFSFDTSGALRATDVGDTKLHRLIYFSADGSRTVTIGSTAQINFPHDKPGSFLFPNGVAVAPNGDVFVSDGDNRRVQVFNSQGVFQRFIDTSGVPRGIALDSQQRLYVADALAHVIAVYDSKGRVLTQFGERGFGPGQFNYPNDIAIDAGGRIYITDRENNQVQVWGWPVAEIPAITTPSSPRGWLTAALCCAPLLLIPFLLLARRKTRIVVTPAFVADLERVGEIQAVSQKPRLRLIAPLEDRPLYEGREVDGIVLTDLLTFEEYSESDARAIVDRLRIAERPAMLLAMAARAKALGTDDHDLRLLALLAETRTVDLAEFREIYLKHPATDADDASV